MLRFALSLVLLMVLTLVSTVACAADGPLPAVPDLAPLLGGLLALAGVVVACVAGVKSLCSLEGWRTVAAIAAVSLLLCTALVAYRTPTLWWQGPILSLLVAILALCGDTYLGRLMLKAGKGG